MLATVVWSLAILAILVLVDRLLLRLESRGWINYRRRGLSRSGAAYHSLTLQSIFNPGAEHVKEIKYQEVREQDESGDPPAPEAGELDQRSHRPEKG
ncbi:MAG: hypothetical protein GTN78_19835 [Gemmatimonadales bacterium]|nr:hypothetical protein [Gemmatimonadales bacterium]NIN12625.1 hypothetical protein [Gemmatimonadales bacterium]NIR02418.1 hypothetical protein [Gemmatimonadales bacterium]NIS66209.1 hypothetical protein [Gemmatimonadales bacterium]